MMDIEAPSEIFKIDEEEEPTNENGSTSPLRKKTTPLPQNRKIFVNEKPNLDDIREDETPTLGRKKEEPLKYAETLEVVPYEKMKENNSKLKRELFTIVI